MRPIIKVDELLSDEGYSKDITVFGVKVYSIVNTDKRAEHKDSPIGFQTMNNILDHYTDI